MAEPKPDKLVQCEACSTTIKKRYHAPGDCPKKRLSRWGWNIEQVEGMEKALMSGQDSMKSITDWTW